MQPRIYDITIQQMEICILAGSYKNFVGVANTLYMSQSTVSKQIKNVEEKIGMPLFIRGKGTSLDITPEGDYLIGEWSKIIKNYNISLINAEKNKKKNLTTINISTLPDFNVPKYLIPKITKFEEEFPNIKINIVHITDADKAKNALIKNNIDVLVCPGLGMESFYTDQFAKRLFLSSPLYFGMLTTNPLAKKKDFSWTDLQKQEFVAINDYLYIKSIMNLCEAENISPKIHCFLPSPYGLAENAHSNDTVFLTADYTKDFGLEGYHYMPIPDTDVKLHLVTYTANIKPIVEIFIDRLAQ